MDSVLMFWGLWGWFDGYSWEDGKNGVGLLEGRRCLLFLYILLYHFLRLDVSMDMRLILKMTVYFWTCESMHPLEMEIHVRDEMSSSSPTYKTPLPDPIPNYTLQDLPEPI